MADLTIKAAPAHIGWVRNWPRWVPYAASAWSLIYGLLGLYWAVGGNGFPYAIESVDATLTAVAIKFGLTGAWIFVALVGLPAAALGILMLRTVRRFRALIITAGILISGILLLVMTDINVLILVGYLPNGLLNVIKGTAFGQQYLQALAQWSFLHQLLCLVGGFLWLGATVSYARSSSDACLYCGRTDSQAEWTSPVKAARWGRIALYVALIAPLVYAVTRFAWALGIPLGMTQAYWQAGQLRGEWISGLFLATFGLVGAALMLGLVQRWGEVFPRWMPFLGGRRVPIALAVVPASIVSVLMIIGGISIGSASTQMAKATIDTNQSFWIVVGPTLLFPVWGVALAVATLGYYFRRRGPCDICGRGEPGSANKP